MSVQKSYVCGLCRTKPDQISHHKSHLETQKHQDKRGVCWNFNWLNDSRTTPTTISHGGDPFYC